MGLFNFLKPEMTATPRLQRVAENKTDGAWQKKEEDDLELDPMIKKKINHQMEKVFRELKKEIDSQKN